jgi:hypothetical protein
LNKQSLDELLFGFFKYYSEFDFKNKVVSVRCGHPVHDLFPPPTFIAIESETRPRHGFDPRRFITIEDVYDVWDNVARGVGELELQRIQWELLVASRILESYARQYDKVRVSQGLLQPVTLPMDLMTQLFGPMPKAVSRSQSPTKQRGKGKPKKPAPIAPPSGPTRLVFSPPSPPALSKKTILIPPPVPSTSLPKDDGSPLREKSLSITSSSPPSPLSPTHSNESSNSESSNSESSNLTSRSESPPNTLQLPPRSSEIPLKSDVSCRPNHGRHSTSDYRSDYRLPIPADHRSSSEWRQFEYRQPSERHSDYRHNQISWKPVKRVSNLPDTAYITYNTSYPHPQTIYTPRRFK